MVDYKDIGSGLMSSLERSFFVGWLLEPAVAVSSHGRFQCLYRLVDDLQLHTGPLLFRYQKIKRQKELLTNG